MPGQLADVSLHWQRYRAARNALGAVLTATKAKDQAAAYKGRLVESQHMIDQMIQDQVCKVRRSALLQPIVNFSSRPYQGSTKHLWVVLLLASVPAVKQT